MIKLLIKNDINLILVAKKEKKIIAEKVLQKKDVSEIITKNLGLFSIAGICHKRNFRCIDRLKKLNVKSITSRGFKY